MNSPVSAPFSRKALPGIVLALACSLLLWGLAPMLPPFLLSIILAYILQPGVAWLTRNRVPRSLGVLIMMSLLIIGVVFLVILVFIVIQVEGPKIQQRLPQLLSTVQEALGPRFARIGLAPNFDLSTLEAFAARHLEGNTSTLFSAIWASLYAGSNMVITVVGRIFIVPLVLYYLLYDWDRLLRRIHALMPRRALATAIRLAGEIDQVLSRYLRGQLLVMGTLAIYYTVCLSVIGLEIALPIGIFTGLAVIVPYVGYCVGLMAALSIALLQFGSWWSFGAIALIYTTGQILESSFLTPRFIGEHIGLHPLAVIFALLAFGQLFGFFGIVFALPASAMLVVAMRELCRHYLSSKLYKMA